MKSNESQTRDDLIISALAGVVAAEVVGAIAGVEFIIYRIDTASAHNKIQVLDGDISLANQTEANMISLHQPKDLMTKVDISMAAGIHQRKQDIAAITAQIPKGPNLEKTAGGMIDFGLGAAVFVFAAFRSIAGLRSVHDRMSKRPTSS